MKIKRIMPLLILVLLLSFVQGAYAASYTASLGTLGTYYGMISYTPFNVDLLGINKTHGFTQKILGTIRIDPDGRYVDVYLDYTVPNDGSTWEVLGTATIQEINSTSTEGNITTSYCLFNVDQTWTTPGTFTGVSLGQAVTAANSANTAANSAKTSADAAKVSADTASTRALNAYNAVQNSNGDTVTAVRDSSGTVLSEARQAKTNSQNASTYASQASTNSLNAYNTAQTVNTKIDSLSTAVTNIQNNMGADTSPPMVNLTTVSGARATSANSIKIVVEVSDNISSTFTYSLNDSSYQPLPADRIVTVPVYGFGSVPINVWIKDAACNKSMDVIFIRKL